MQNRSSRLLIALIISAISLLVISGCGKSGTRFDNQLPTIRITSYEGFDGSETYSSQDTLTFQQRIYWHANDPDGVIEGYAYRILDDAGNPVSTPGNAYIDADGSVAPANVIETYGNGWVLHYLPGADQGEALDSPEAARSIWTSKKYTTVNFPSADANGNPLPKLNKFEVIAVDNRGGVTAVAAYRNFNTNSLRPTCTVTTTKGNPGGAAVGSGMKLSFAMNDENPFVSNTPWYYEFKLQKLNAADSTLIEESDWFRTDRPGNPKINEYLLNGRDTNPLLTYDYNDAGEQVTLSRIIGRVYNLSGVVSETSALGANLLFAVKPGFRPMSIIWPQKTHALGDNHFLDYTYDDQKTPAEVLPFTIKDGDLRYAIPLFRDFTNTGTAVNSNDFKLWVRWGWDGEYGKVQANGNILYEDVTPYDKKVDTVLNADPNNRVNYYSEVVAFDLRFNDEPYNFPPYANSIQVDDDGTRWLRIPVNSALGQGLVLTNLPSGQHKLEVRVVDLQNIPSETSSLIFNLVDPIAPADRNGILIIDDDSANPVNSPEPIVTDLYNAMFEDYNGPVDVIRLPTSDGQTFIDRRDRRLSYSELQKYDMIVYHSDNPFSTGTLGQDCDALYLYLKHDGNLLVSSSSKLTEIISFMVTQNQQTLLEALGLPYATNALISAGSLNSNPFLVKATGMDGFGDIDLRLQPGDAPETWVNTLISNPNNPAQSRMGLGAVSIFDNYTGEPIFGYGCKPTTATNYPPSEDQFNNFDGRTVGIRKVNGNGRAYTLGFPLSFMDLADSKAFVNRVLTECGIQ